MEETEIPMSPLPNGKLVIIGGAENKSSAQESTDINNMVLKEFIEFCGEEPTIEIITTAGTQEVDDTFEKYSACFKDFGAKTTGHIHHDTRETDLEDLIARIKKADGIFFSGGDQLKLTAIYGGTDFMYVIKRRYILDGLVIGGTSAGAMAMSTPMIFDGSGEVEMVAAGVKITTGFEFLKDVCVDTHFVHRGRFVRMAQVIATNPASIGIGIEEDTAIVVSEGRKAKVIGTGVVIVIDGESSHGSNIEQFDEQRKITIRDLRVSILSKGEELIIPARNPPHV